jgi:plasmid stability protein
VEDSLADELRCHRNVLQSNSLVKDSEAREIGLHAIDAFEQLPAGAEPSSQCLEALAIAASSHEAHVACTAADLLYRLWPHHEVVRNTIRRLQDGNEHSRYWAISAATMHRPVPDPFVKDILRRGLADENTKVSMHAAQKVTWLGIRELLPAMLQMRIGLTNQNDIEWCDLYIDLLRDEYQILQLSGGECHVSVRLDNGYVVGWMGKESDVYAKGAAAFANQIAQQYLADEAKREAERCKGKL